MRLDRIDQRLPRHYFLHLGKGLLILGTLFDGALFVINEDKLLADHRASPSIGL